MSRLTRVVRLCLLCVGALAAESSPAAERGVLAPLRASADGHFLETLDGKPFFWLADTAWALFARLDRAEADVYLQDRARKGFTVIQAVAWGGPWEGGVADLNRYGQRPLLNKDPARPNPRYFEVMDWVVARAKLYGFRMAILPTWGIATISGQHLYTVQSAQDYGHWLGNRYKGQGVLWVLGGDMIPVAPTDLQRPESPLLDNRRIYDALAKGLREGEGGRPFITYHPCGLSFSSTARPRTSLFFRDRDWLDMNMLQSSHFKDPSVFFKEGFDFGWDATRNYEPIAEEYRSIPVRPVVDGETRYEDEPVDVVYETAKGYWTAYDSRNAAYHAVFAGAAGHTYGDNSVHQFYDSKLRKPDEWVRSSWQTELNAPGAQSMHLLKDLMLSRPYFTRIPDQSIVVGETFEGSAHISGTRDRTGAYLLIYLPEGQAVTVDLTKLSGASATAWWCNPRTGVVEKLDGDFRTNQALRFTPPSAGKDQDWVLAIDDASRGFETPGAKAIE